MRAAEGRTEELAMDPHSFDEAKRYEGIPENWTPELITLLGVCVCALVLPF